MGDTVSNIIVNKLIDKIEKESKLPWMRPFVTGCRNWETGKEYRGINRWLLDGGEYVTPNQLKKYNEKNKTSYWFKKGTPYDLVVFYGCNMRELNDKEQDAYDSGKFNENMRKRVVTKNNILYLKSWVLRYYHVYNIQYIEDKGGNKLPSNMSINPDITEVKKPEDLVKYYCENTGVKVNETSNDGAYYIENYDSVYLPPRSQFVSMESFYRTLFHELVHSTGVNTRLNRECFKKYAETKQERSKEELIAEVGSMLLSNEVGFSIDTDLGKNSENYVAGWVKWMKENTSEVVLGMQQAEKAVAYVVSGGANCTYTTDEEADTTEGVA